MAEDGVEISLRSGHPHWPDEYLTITRDTIRTSSSGTTREIHRSRVRRILLMTLEKPTPPHLPHAIRIDNRWFSPWFVGSVDTRAFRQIQTALRDFDWTMVRERDIEVRKQGIR